MKFYITFCVMLALMPFATAWAQQGSLSWWLAQKADVKPQESLAWIGQQDRMNWPLIHSEYYVKKQSMPMEEHDKSVDLAKWVVSSAKSYANQPASNYSELKQWVLQAEQTFVKIEMRTSYGNTLIADAIRRAVLFRVSSHLLNEPNRFKEVADMLKEVSRRKPDAFTLATHFKNEDPVLDGIELKQTKSPPSSLIQQMIAMGIPESVVYSNAINGSPKGVMQLIQSPDVPGLIARVSFTDHLHAFIEQAVVYAEHGGRFSEEEILNKQNFLNFMARNNLARDSISKDGLNTLLQIHNTKSDIGIMFQKISFE